MRLLEIKSNDAGQRLDKFLSKAVKDLPQSLMYKSIRTKKIKVNRKRAEPSQILNEGDTVQLFLSEDIFSDKPDQRSFSHITPSFGVVYEDRNLILCDKPAGVSVQPDENTSKDTLITQIQAYLFQKGEYDPSGEQSFAPALCNRIDRNTGGIVIAAKNAAALREANALIKERAFEKKYLCAAHGHFEKSSGTLNGFMTKDSLCNTVRIYRENEAHPPYAKTVTTKYRVLTEREGLSLVEAELVTGRTHQIRAQLAAEGHPLVGDGKYAKNASDRALGYKYQALYSYSLTFHGGKLLKYLDGKTFYAERENIWFMELFPGYEL